MRLNNGFTARSHRESAGPLLMLQQAARGSERFHHFPAPSEPASFPLSPTRKLHNSCRLLQARVAYIKHRRARCFGWAGICAYLVHAVIEVCVLLLVGWILQIRSQGAVRLCKEDPGNVAAVWGKCLLHLLPNLFSLRTCDPGADPLLDGQNRRGSQDSIAALASLAPQMHCCHPLPR